MYTKTALKKIKKDDLVQMFLDLQAKKVDYMMDQVVEEVVKGMKSVIEEVKEENQKLKEENKKQKVLIVNETIEKEKFKNENDTRKDIVDELRKDLEAAEHTIQHSNSTWQKSYEKLEKQMQGAQYSKGICDELSKQIKQLKEEKINQQTVIPENIKGDWMNIWDCLLEEEENCYNQEGHDIEAETSELEDGYTYTSMRRIHEWINQN